LGIFSKNYDRPGPGVSKDEPKKKGIERFVELLLREFSDLVKLNLLFCLFAAPSAVFFTLGLFGVGGFYVFILSAAAAFPIGGAVAACMFCTVKMLRDDPGYLIFEFKRKFRENVLQTAWPGILSAVFTYTQLYVWANMLFGFIPASYGTMALLVVAAVFIGMITPYFFLQAAHLELKNFQLIKNSVFLAIKSAPKSFCGMLLGQAIFIVSFLLFPLSLWWTPFLLLIGFAVSRLITLMWIWPGVDEVFAINDALNSMREQKTDGVETIFSAREPTDARALY